VLRNYFLDWGGLGYMSALEQNFNPSIQDIKRCTDLGKWKNHLSPEREGEKIWESLFFCSNVIPAYFRVICWCLKPWPTGMKTLCSPVLLMLMFTTTPNIDVTCCNFPCTLFEPFAPGCSSHAGGAVTTSLIRHHHYSWPTPSSTLYLQDVLWPICLTTCCPPIWIWIWERPTIPWHKINAIRHLIFRWPPHQSVMPRLSSPSTPSPG